MLEPHPAINNLLNIKLNTLIYKIKSLIFSYFKDVNNMISVHKICFTWAA